MGEYFSTIGGSVFIGYGLATYDYITLAAGVTMVVAMIIQQYLWREHDRRND